MERPDPQFYIIGGASLAGKTHTAQRFLHEQPMLSIATDPTRRILWDILDEQDEPALFQMFRNRQELAHDRDWIARATQNPEFFLDNQIKQFEVVWRRGMLGQMACNADRNIQTLVEGMVFPEYLHGLTYNHRAVFIGNQATGRSQMSAVLAEAANPGHWLHGWSEAKIRAYLHVRAHTSRYYEQQAEQYGYPYVEMSEGGFERSMGRAVMELVHPTIPL